MEPDSSPTPDDLSIYERERRDKREKLRAMNLDPYGGRTEGVQPLEDVQAHCTSRNSGQDGGPISTVAGRVMFRKSVGKLTFMTLRDETGDLQVAV